MQQLHYDFEGSWKHFDEQSLNTRMTPLSLLFFPNGGALVVYPCDRTTSWDYRRRCGVYLTDEEKKKLPNGGKIVPKFGLKNVEPRNEKFNFGKYVISYEKKAITAKVLVLKPGQTVIFGGIFLIINLIISNYKF